MIDKLYEILLYANALAAFATMIIYILAARKANKPFKLFKYMIAAVMASSVFIYVQLALPGEFLEFPQTEAMMVRVNYSAIIAIFLLSGLMGIGGHGNNGD